MKSKATFLTFVSIGGNGRDNIVLLHPPWNRKKQCSPHFTNEKRALNFATKVGRVWKNDNWPNVKAGVVRVDAVLPPLTGDWSALERYGIKEVKL